MDQFPPPATTRLERFDDETDSSSVSDYDSEWTQISGADEDHPAAARRPWRPLSRAGTIDGSVDDDDVWEGFIDGSEVVVSNDEVLEGRQQEPTDTSSDEDDYEGAYGAPNHRGDVDDELPDTTMLDSVVLPAIASVSPFSRAGGVRVGSGFC